MEGTTGRMGEDGGPAGDAAKLGLASHLPLQEPSAAGISYVSCRWQGFRARQLKGVAR